MVTIDRRRALLSLVLLRTSQAWAAPTPSRESQEEALSLCNSGIADMEIKLLEPACDKLARSQRLDPHPGTQYALATCEDRRGRVASAIDGFREYLNGARTLTDDTIDPSKLAAHE